MTCEEPLLEAKVSPVMRSGDNEPLDDNDDGNDDDDDDNDDADE